MKILLLITFLLTAGCASNKVFTDGAYNDPKSVRLLDDKFNEADVQKFSESMINKINACPKVFSNKTIIWGGVKNLTNEHLDTQMISNVITSSLTNQNKLIFINKNSRDELSDEYTYEQDSGYVRNPGAVRQVASDYFISGSIHSNVQEVGKDKLVYYQMSLNVTDSRTNMILCSHTDDLRKEFRKRKVSE